MNYYFQRLLVFPLFALLLYFVPRVVGSKDYYKYIIGTVPIMFAFTLDFLFKSFYYSIIQIVIIVLVYLININRNSDNKYFQFILSMPIALGITLFLHDFHFTNDIMSLNLTPNQIRNLVYVSVVSLGILLVVYNNLIKKALGENYGMKYVIPLVIYFFLFMVFCNFVLSLL